MPRLYVLGARQRNLLLRREEEWNLYEAALVLEIDTDSQHVRTCVEYKTPLEAKANENSSCVFKSGTLTGNTLYTCTSTEIVIFHVPHFHRTGYISLPFFNDLHHVAPSADGNLLVAVTGLDMVAKIAPDGALLREWCVLEEEPWTRFSRHVDYRKVDSTKPHQSHPNFVFELEGETWVTRFRQRDAICLNNRARTIEIAVQRPHDGICFEGRLYFSTVDGKIVIVDPSTLKTVRVIDLQAIGGGSILGWCRGLLPLAGNQVWVGFTRIRKTRFHENVLWLRNAIRDGIAEKPSHIALYDIDTDRCLQEYNLEAHGMNVIFSIFPVVSKTNPI